MRLNIDILRDHLPPQFQTKRYGPQNRSCAYARPMIYEGLESLERGELYLSTTELLEGQRPVPGSAVVAIGTRLNREWASSGMEVLLITSGCTLIQLFNEIQRIYNTFDSWDEEIRAALDEEDDFDLNHIMALGSRQLERSISISDRSLCNFMRATYERLPDGTGHVEVTDEPTSMDIDHGAMIREACQLERVITVPYISAIVSDTSRYYCYNVYIMGTFSGCFSIDDGGDPFRESDFPIMDYFLKYLEKGYSKYIYKYSQSSGGSRLAALQKLLTHRLLTASELAYFTLAPGENWRCFWLKESSQTKAYPREYMYAMINALMPGVGYATVVHDELMGLLRLRDETAEETMEVFSNMVQRMGYFGGVSNPFWNLNQVPDYLRQAGYAAERCGGKKKPVAGFSGYTLGYMLSACVGEMPLQTLLSEGLLTLLNNDRERGAEYLKTLDVYLKNEMNITRTAECLFIHRSSLIKRLDKIQRLLGNDLSKPNMRLYYRMCLALMEREGMWE